MTELARLDADAMSQPSEMNRSTSHPSAIPSVKSGVPKIAQVIAAEIRVRIVRRELKLGENLPPEAKLASLYGVSRPTIREALRLLESEHLLSVRRGGRLGAEIVAPDVEFIAHSVATLLQYQGTKVADVWSAWSAMECMSIATLAQQKGTIELAGLRNIIAQTRQVVEVPQLYTDLGLEFSEELVRLAGNETILVLFRLLRNIIVAEIGAVRRHIDPNGLQWMREDGPDFMDKILDMVEHGDLTAVSLWRERLAKVAAFQLEVIGPATVVDILSLQA